MELCFLTILGAAVPELTDRITMTQQVYTIYATPRQHKPDGYTFLVIAVEWNPKADIMAIDIPNEGRMEFYRRGRPIFKSWADGCTYVRQHGWPLND